MKILLIGASSYVGARLFFDLRGKHNVIGTYNQNQLLPEFIALDVTDADKVREVVREHKPEVIIHTANNASVKWCETHPEEAKVLNETSTQTIADAANEVGARLIYFSSFAAINAAEVYGKTKRNSEEITKQVAGGWVVVRPSLIVGCSPNTANDRFFNRLLANIDEGAAAEYDTSWRLQLTWLGHISEVVSQVLENEISNQVLPVAVDEMSSRYNFAKDLLASFEIGVTPVDGGHSAPELHEDLGILRELNLPTYSYSEIVEKITKEIHERNKFVL